MQPVVSMACKILRVFYTILTKGVDYGRREAVGRHQEATDAGSIAVRKAQRRNNALSRLDSALGRISEG